MPLNKETKPNHQKPSEQDTGGEARRKSSLTFFYGTLHIDVSLLGDQQELIYICSVKTLGDIWSVGW